MEDAEEVKDAEEPNTFLKPLSSSAKASLLIYLVVVLISEVLAATGSFEAGLAIHLFLLFLLIVHASAIAQSDALLSKLLAAMTLVPILRILSLTIPYWPFTIVQWYAIISVPLLAACASTIIALRLRLKDIGLSLSPPRRLPLQLLIGLIGIPLGIVEFHILRPSPWLPDYGFGNLALAFIGLVCATGLAEELIFRGILQRCAVDLMGIIGIVYISVVFASLHISFLSVADIIFVFLVALLFAYIVHKTKMIIGVVVAHTMVNVILYLVLPSLP